jgi:hypothetical protein
MFPLRTSSRHTPPISSLVARQDAVLLAVLADAGYINDTPHRDPPASVASTWGARQALSLSLCNIRAVGMVFGMAPIANGTELIGTAS